MGFDEEEDVDVITKEVTETEESDKTDDGKVLVLLNDSENTFEHVENCLISICKHSTQQAKNSAMTVHKKGRCDVYKGAFSKLKKMMWALQIKGLLAKIEDA